MTDALDTLEQERRARRPWLAPDDWSVWLATGDYPRGGSFTRCLIIAVPRFASPDGPLYVMFPPLHDAMIDPEWITSARRLVLVYADEPTTPHFDYDAEFVAGLTSAEDVRCLVEAAEYRGYHAAVSGSAR